MRVFRCPQRSPEWFQARLGHLTGSVAKDMMATIKSGEAATRRNLRTRLVVERLTSAPQDDGFTSAAMQHGIDKEPDAFAAYMGLTGEMASLVGFVGHDELLAGCSPDGIVGDFEGVLELKCPMSATHLDYLRGGTVPAFYRYQLIHNLWITGAQWADFVSFDDRFPESLQVVRYRLLASDIDLQAYELAVRMFLNEVDQEVNELTSRIGAMA